MCITHYSTLYSIQCIPEENESFFDDIVLKKINNKKRKMYTSISNNNIINYNRRNVASTFDLQLGIFLPLSIPFFVVI